MTESKERLDSLRATMDRLKALSSGQELEVALESAMVEAGLGFWGWGLSAGLHPTGKLANLRSCKRDWSEE